MKKGLRIFCLFIVAVFMISVLHAQDLTGIWRGHFRSNEGLEQLLGNNEGRIKYDDRYKMEVQIAQSNNHFEAITYSYRSTEFYAKAEASGNLNTQTQKVLLKEGKLLEVRFASGFVCVMTCFFRYTRLGDDEYLQGTYYSVRESDTMADCGKGSIFLHRVVESDFYKEPFLVKKEMELLARKKNPGTKITAAPAPSEKKSIPKTSMAKKKPATKAPTLAGTVKTVPKKVSAKPPVTTAMVKKKPAPVSQPLAAQKKSSVVVTQQSRNTRDSAIKIPEHAMPVVIPDVLKSRANVLLKTIAVNHNKIELRIYDDGAIDNDTVSVYYDNKLILYKVRLTDQPVTMHITVEPSDHPHQLVMVAENLGEIPPNTSLLVVRDGEKRYEERIISSEQKNVQLNFLYKKIE